MITTSKLIGTTRRALRKPEEELTRDTPCLGDHYVVEGVMFSAETGQSNSEDHCEILDREITVKPIEPDQVI